MYFIVIMAFAFVLSDNLPPARFSMFRMPVAGPLPTGVVINTLIMVVAPIVLTLATAACIRIHTLRKIKTAGQADDPVAETYARGQRLLVGMMGAALAATMLTTPWMRLVRQDWGLGGIPVASEAAALIPFFATLILTWVVLFPAELALRHPGRSPIAPPQPGIAMRGSWQALAAARLGKDHGSRRLTAYLVDKVRHNLLIVAAPMVVIVAARYFTNKHQDDLINTFVVPWAADAALGCVSAVVLLFSPVMLRFVWVTEPLPAGPLRDRLERMCKRVGLRYREILLWHTHRMTVNAAVMGFVAPLRYILISDALLETMDEEEIEAVFAHEAGHVRHWHLQYFALFVLVTMYITGGVLELLIRSRWGWTQDAGMLQMVSLALLLTSWLVGFGWVSRAFERQADLFGVRCVTADIATCAAWCPIHGSSANAAPAAVSASPPLQPAGVAGFVTPGRGASAANLPRLCIGAAALFGRTLQRIADLNGIPRDAPSWRHGSIDSRCQLIERHATDPRALARFDRKLVLIKVGLVLAVVVGTIVAAWLYWDDLRTAAVKFMK